MKYSNIDRIKPRFFSKLELFFSNQKKEDRVSNAFDPILPITKIVV